MSGLNDLSRAYEIFVEKFPFIYDKRFLLRAMKARRFNLREPGLLKALLNLKGRNKSYSSSFLNTPNSSTDNADNSYDSFVIHFELQSVYIAKKKLEKLKSSVKATWRVLNEVLKRRKGKRGLSSIYRALRFSRNFES